MTDQEKKTSRWDTLAQELGADAKPLPKRPTPPAATTAPAPLPPVPAAPPVETAKRSGWDDLTSWLGIGGAKRARAEAPPAAAAPPAAPPPPAPRPVEDRPRRESAFRADPLPRPEAAPPARPPRSEPRSEPRSVEALGEPVREPGPAIGSRGREFDDFRDALQEEQDVLQRECAPADDEPLGERPASSEGGRGTEEEQQRRRRRRRGGRGRGRGRPGEGDRPQGDRPPRDPARSTSGRPPEPRRDSAGETDAEFVEVDDHDDFDADHHSDADVATPRDAADEPFETVEGERDRGGEDGRPRPRRRRRRRGGRGREGSRPGEATRGSESSTGAPSSARSSEGDDDFHDDDGHHDEDSAIRDRDRRIIHDSDDHDEHVESHPEDDHDAGEDLHQIHKGIPTWDEAVGHVINANMESRARNPNPQGGHRGGHRGGGRGRGGRDRH